MVIQDKTHLKSYSKEGQEASNSTDMNSDSSFSKEDINTPKHIPYVITIQVIRTSKGLSQAALGRLCGFTGEYINMIERGKLFPILETRIRIARALECDTSALWIPKEEQQ